MRINDIDDMMEDDDIIPIDELLEEIASSVDGRVYNEYSGRGMMGKTCKGIVCSNPMKVIEMAAANKLFGAKMDSMGTEYIVYWSNPNYEGVEEIYYI